MITKRHNLRDNLEDLVTFPLLASTFGARGHRNTHDLLNYLKLVFQLMFDNRENSKQFAFHSETMTK